MYMFRVSLQIHSHFIHSYFVWDMYICAVRIKENGWQMLVHALASFAVFLFGLGPFTFYYGAVFILFELSTPFLNIHWFLDKVR